MSGEFYPNQFKRLFPNASKSVAERNYIKDYSVPQNAKPEPIIQHDVARSIQRVEENSGKVLISITSYRMRLLDSDGQVEKYFVDCLRYSQLIRDDSEKQATIPRARQVKVKTKEEERVEFEITYL